jgi:lysophospholipase L1-like esterase
MKGRKMRRYLALGDSYTIGEGVTPDQRWPVQLASLLQARGIPLAEPLIIARTGWTTDELARGLQDAAPVGPFDMVSLLIGVNNQYRGRDLDEYRLQFTDLLGQAVALAGGVAGHVLVLSIPDWGVTPYAMERGRVNIGTEIDAFNAAALAVCRHHGAYGVDITPLSRARDAGSMVVEDGLHPSGAMYAAWAEAALPAALTILQSDSE